VRPCEAAQFRTLFKSQLGHRDRYIFGADVVPQGVNLSHRGNLLLAPYFNRHGWYWGAGFSGDSVDSMHFELAEETVHKIPKQPMFDPEVALGSGSYRPDPKAAGLLGDIVRLLANIKPIPNSFTAVKLLGTLPEGQLYFDSELQLDTDGWPDGKGRGDPDWQPTTTLTYEDDTPINSNNVPFFVLPKQWSSQFNIKLGDLGAIIYKDKIAFAMFADVGPASKLGEGSLSLLRRLGAERLKADGKVINSGMGPGVITIVFPGSRPVSRPINEATLLDYIDQNGKDLFVRLGGNPVSQVAAAKA
jgi:hypothetical protein